MKTRIYAALAVKGLNCPWGSMLSLLFHEYKFIGFVGAKILPDSSTAKFRVLLASYGI